MQCTRTHPHGRLGVMRIDVARRPVLAALLATMAPPPKASWSAALPDTLLRERDQAVLLDFRLPCLNVKGKQQCSVRDFLDDNKYVVLYFFPNDPTHIEDANNELEVLNFERMRDEFDNLDAVLLGVSNMDLSAQKMLVDGKLLTIPFVSDRAQKLAAAFGAERATFIIDPNGTIRWLERNVEYGVGNFNLQNHATRVARTLYQIRNADGWSV